MVKKNGLVKITRPKQKMLPSLYQETLEKMDIDTGTLDLITGILGITIFIGGMVMMFTTVFTTKR